jgi:putative phosphoesterase
MRLGVISDTHGYLDPKIPALFEGVDHILHAGDIGSPTILSDLERIAPITAVLGNNDFDLALGELEIVTLDGRKILLHHIVDLRDPAALIRERIDREKPDVVIFGHTHKPFSEQRGRTFYLNPGYAGGPRFNLSRSVAILHCDATGLRPEFKALQ